MTGVGCVSCDGDPRVHAFPACKSAGVIVDGNLLHEFKPTLLLPLARDALERGKPGKCAKHLYDTVSLLRQDVAVSWLVPFVPHETDEAGEREAGFVTTREDGRQDGQR